MTGKFSAVADKIKLAGPFTLWNGAVAAASATFIGHYPWYVSNIVARLPALMES